MRRAFIFVIVLTSQLPANLRFSYSPIAENHEFDVGDLLISGFEIFKMSAQTFEAGRISIW